jgi:hypothetical protein
MNNRVETELQKQVMKRMCEIAEIRTITSSDKKIEICDKLLRALKQTYENEMVENNTWVNWIYNLFL